MAGIIFRRNMKERTLESYLVLQCMDSEGLEFEKELSFTCGEDLQNYMVSIFKKDYTSLFEPHELPRNTRITECNIKGISVKGKSSEGSFAVHILDGYSQGSCGINENILNEKNAQKMKEIEAIIKR